MVVYYKKTRKLLIDKGMKKKNICALADIGPASVSKMGQGRSVNTIILEKKRTALNCDIDDITEIVYDVKLEKGIFDNATDIY